MNTIKEPIPWVVMSKLELDISKVENNAKKLLTLYELLIDFNLFGDDARCKVRNMMVTEFFNEATEIATLSGYEGQDGKADPFEAYPDEIYHYLKSNSQKIKFVDVFLDAIGMAMSPNNRIDQARGTV